MTSKSGTQVGEASYLPPPSAPLHLRTPVPLARTPAARTPRPRAPASPRPPSHAPRPTPTPHGKYSHPPYACTATLEPRAEKLAAHSLSFGLSIAAVKFSPDGSKIASAGVDGSIKVWSAGVSRAA